MLNEIELFKEPLNIRKNLSVQYHTEMTEWQLGFLCGLIKKYKPHKIVEVGVGSGGTTGLILSCISTLGLDTEVHSVDINKMFYKDGTKETGYLIEKIQDVLAKDIPHTTYYGGILPEYIEMIGEGIDFLVLDTSHVLPGEVLDFLVCLPKMKNGSIVVLHDIILNHLLEKSEWCFATKVLLSSVVGEKIMCKEDSNPYNYPGIGAFRITEDTRKYIENVFLTLTITWPFIPNASHINLYKQYFRKYYEDVLCGEFDAAVSLNQKSYIRESARKKSQIKKGLFGIGEIVTQLMGKKNVYVYGCGFYGKRIYNVLEHFGISLIGYVISDSEDKSSISSNGHIEFISSVDTDECFFVLGMDTMKQVSISKEHVRGTCIFVNESVLDFLRALDE